MQPDDQSPSKTIAGSRDDRIRQKHQDYAASVPSIVSILDNFFKCRTSTVLPGLAILSLFKVADDVFSINTVVDECTGLLDFIESTLLSHDHVGTAYFIATNNASVQDIDDAVLKSSSHAKNIKNIVIVTTGHVRSEVADYAATVYELSGGTEAVVLNFSDFIMHFLYVFYQRRTEFLDSFESLLLSQTDSCVGSMSKEVFLAIRRAALTPE